MGACSGMLTTMFNGHLPAIRTPEGRPFIDRDGDQFGTILSFLRTGASTKLPGSGSELAVVLEDAEFYQGRCWVIRGTDVMLSQHAQ